MATRASQLILDQNINFHCDGASFGMNTNNNVSKDQKKGGKLGARRALNDISNSTKPSALQAPKKTNPSIVSIGKDVDDSKTKVKKHVGGRKALGDLTNSSKLSVHNKGYDEKMSAIAEEGFLHNHHKCIKEQRKAMDVECFLKEVGLGASSKPLLLTPRAAYPTSMRSKMKTEVKGLEMEELPELMIPFYNSPVRESPMSPKALCLIDWKDDNFPGFSLIATPMLPKNS